MTVEAVAYPPTVLTISLSFHLPLKVKLHMLIATESMKQVVVHSAILLLTTVQMGRRLSGYQITGYKSLFLQHKERGVSKN
ncbi:MAG: hypothetical protein C0392_03065 [Syntrophus sp. (in: bacteria)]|nr:hypothetical protein [Syntrophus sp. (in: bacteria)]